MDKKRNEIILFENQGVKLEVNLKDETVWLNRQQLADLFEIGRASCRERV